MEPLSLDADGAGDPRELTGAGARDDHDLELLALGVPDASVRDQEAAALAVQRPGDAVDRDVDTGAGEGL